MNEKERNVMDDLQYYFIVKHVLPDDSVELALSSYAPFRDDRTTLSFDSERDAALYLLDEFHNGAIVAENDVETAKAILRGEQPLFLYEEKQADGTLVLSLHDCLPPEGSKIVTFGSRAPKLVARLLLRRLHESKCVRATEETIRHAHLLMEQG
jgi:hypothetical protein